MKARPIRSLSPVLTGALAACLVGLALLTNRVAGQTQPLSLDVLSRDGRRAIPITVVSGQEMLSLDDLVGRFQLNVRDDGGALTVGYKGRTIVLTQDQTIASVAGRLISLPAAPVRVNGRWLVPVDFVSRALAPVYDVRLDLRRASHLLVVGDLRVPRVSVRVETLAAAARVVVDLVPAATPAVSQQGAQRLLLRFDADAIDVTLPTAAPSPFVQTIRQLDAVNLAIELGPRFASFRVTTQPTDTGTHLTVDIVGAVTDATPVLPPSTPPAADAPALPAAGGGGAGIRTVAIDAGHGGDDVGVRGGSGALEKDLTLVVGRRLKAALEARLGVRVVMTREDDRLVPAGNRSAVANNNKADLFISLHANASFRPETSGATVYVASFTEAELANEVLAPERLPVFGGGLRTIEIVPWRLAQIPHRDRSGQFAQALLDALGGRVPLAAQPLEHAPVRVLESVNMPAVLLEMGYLTNPAQEQAFATGDAQNAVAQALLDAVLHFRETLAAEVPGR